MKSVLRTLSVMLLTAAAVTGAGVWAVDLEEAGLPVTQDGSLWARKSGTTNTKQDLLSTSNALHVSVQSSGTGTSSTAVQGPVADGAADTAAAPVEIGGSDGTNIQTIKTDTTGAVATFSAAPAAASILAASQSYTATQAATTIITIPAGNVWVGEVSISASVGVVAASATAGQALGIVTTVGAGTTPAAAQVFDCQALAGANAATGVTGSNGNNSCRLAMIINCASGTCTIAGATTQAGTASRVSFSAAGRLY